MQLVVITDFADDILDIPIDDDLLLNVLEHKQQILSLFNSLPLLHQNNIFNGFSNTSHFVRSLKLTLSIIKNIGGKLLIFQRDKNIINETFFNLPDQKKNADTKDMKKVYNFSLASIAREYSNLFISVNIFVFQTKQFKVTFIYLFRILFIYQI